jgi:hypothetical protein
MLELLPFMFKRPTARTRPAECEFNYEEMGKPSLLVASMKNIEKERAEHSLIGFRKRRFTAIVSRFVRFQGIDSKYSTRGFEGLLF